MASFCLIKLLLLAGALFQVFSASTAKEMESKLQRVINNVPEAASKLKSAIDNVAESAKRLVDFIAKGIQNYDGACTTGTAKSLALKVLCMKIQSDSETGQSEFVSLPKFVVGGFKKGLRKLTDLPKFAVDVFAKGLRKLTDLPKFAVDVFGKGLRKLTFLPLMQRPLLRTAKNNDTMSANEALQWLNFFVNLGVFPK